MNILRTIMLLCSAALASASVAQTPAGANIIFIGNSITYGATLENRETQAPPAVVKQCLEERGTVGRVEVVNLGVCGATTVDWLPQTNTLWKTIEEPADRMAQTDVPLIFSLSIGTNDSAIEGTNGAPLTDEAYADNLYQIIDALMVRYPRASVVVNHPIWYSDNTYNGAKYLAEGQARLSGYRAVIDQVVNDRFRARDRGRAFVGDTQGWDTFCGQTPLFTPEDGVAGTFYLHPNKDGARKLGTLWAAHIYEVWRHETPERIELSSGAYMLLYRAQGQPSGKAIVVCPGGGYEFLAAEHEGTRLAHWFSQSGTTSAVLMYRMPRGDKNVPLTDAREALDMMRQKAAEWGGYAQVGIMGSSAGGHLASTAATHLTAPSAPDFQILLYPVISMAEGITHQGSRENLLGRNPSAQEVSDYSNHTRVNSSTPRAFIFLAANDDLVPAQNSLDYARALIANGVPTTLHAYPTGGHGWGWSDGFFYKKQWTSELMRWLQQF